MSEKRRKLEREAEKKIKEIWESEMNTTYHEEDPEIIYSAEVQISLLISTFNHVLCQLYMLAENKTGR